MRRALLLLTSLYLAACSSTTKPSSLPTEPSTPAAAASSDAGDAVNQGGSAAAPTPPGPPPTAPTGVPTDPSGQPSPGTDDVSAPVDAQSCAATCKPPARCITVVGMREGPSHEECWIPCAGGARCPAGMSCTMKLDGPGHVCVKPDGK